LLLSASVWDFEGNSKHVGGFQSLAKLNRRLAIFKIAYKAQSRIRHSRQLRLRYFLPLSVFPYDPAKGFRIVNFHAIFPIGNFIMVFVEDQAKNSLSGILLKFYRETGKILPFGKKRCYAVSGNPLLPLPSVPFAPLREPLLFSLLFALCSLLSALSLCRI
jgi:hypothetical protein